MPSNVFIIPVIRREDFDAFRRDIGMDPKETFDGWSALLAGELEEARRQGKTVVEADVQYSAFIDYCASRALKPDAALLLEFVSRPRPLSEA